MDIQELIEQAGGTDQPDTPQARREAFINGTVALAVALLSTFLAICTVKDDNIVQAMQSAQAEKIDQWGFYQARQLREELAEATATELELARSLAPEAQQSAFDTHIARYRARAQDQAEKKEAVRVKAEAAERSYAELNVRDDQLDLSEALLAIAIALLAVTALTKLWWLLIVSMVPTALGVAIGLAGLAGWSLRWDSLARLLS